MDGNVLLVIKTDDRVNHLQNEKKEKREPNSSFVILLNGLMTNQVNQTSGGEKETVKSVRTFGIAVAKVEEKHFFEHLKELTKIKSGEIEKEESKQPLRPKMAKREERKVDFLKEEEVFFNKKYNKGRIKESKEEKTLRGVEKRKKDVVQLSWQKRVSKVAKKVADRNNSSKIPTVTKSMQTEKFPENLMKRNLKLKAEKVEYRQLIQDKESTIVKKKEVLVGEGKVFSKVFKEYKEGKGNDNKNSLTVKLDSFNSSHNISQEKSINLNGSRASQVELQTLREFVKSHYEPMEGVVRFYTEMSEKNSVKVLLNSRLGIAKLLFLSTQNNFQINSSVIQNLINTLNNLGFSNVSVGYNNYYGEGKNNGNQSFRENRGSKFIPVAEVEPEEEELIVQNGIDIMV
ncbi:hypothetical protein [Desulfurobacterium crinifex]